MEERTILPTILMKLLAWKEFRLKSISDNGGQLVTLDGAIYYGGSAGQLYEYIESEEQWELMPLVDVWGFGLGVCNGNLVIIGGKNLSFSASKDMWLFEKDRRWTRGIPMLDDCVHPSVLSISSGLVVMGGKINDDRRVQVFKSSEQQWYFGGALPVGCSRVVSTSHNGDIVFINNVGSKSVWCAGIKDVIKDSDLSVTENQVWKPLKDGPHCNFLLCTFNAVLLALGGLKEPNELRSVYAYNFNSQEWSYIATMPHGFYNNNIAALELPEKQQLMLLQASKQLFMKGTVLDYDYYMTYKITLPPRNEKFHHNRDTSTDFIWKHLHGSSVSAANENAIPCTMEILKNWEKIGKHLSTVHSYSSLQSSLTGTEARSISDSLHNTGLPYTEATSELSNTRPTMPKLLSFFVTKMATKMNIAVQIGIHYTKFGIFLLEDHGGAIVSALEHEHHWNAEKINMAILQRWLEGKGAKPVTWSTLVTVIRSIEMNDLADTISSEVC